MIALPPIASVLGSVAGFIAVTTWRLREVRTAVSLRKIIIPPLGMATGFSMFFAPAFRIPLAWAAIAFLIGSLALAWPLLLTTRLIRQGDAIMMKRSKAFLTVIFALFAIRLLARGYFDSFMTLEQTGALFFVLAFGMIVHWRLRMLLDFRRLRAIPAEA